MSSDAPQPWWQACCTPQFVQISQFYSKKLRKFYAPVRHVLFYNPWITAIFFMVLFMLISFLPIFYHQNKYDDAFLANHHEYNVFFSASYKQWLLITLLVAIPLVINLLLDARWTFQTTVDFNHWLSRLVFLCALCMPNACLLIIIYGDYDSANSYIPQLQLSLFLSQQVMIVGSFFGTLFGQKMHSVSNPNDHLKISVEERTVYFLITFVVGKLFLFFASLKREVPSTSLDGVYVVGLLLIGFGVLQVVLVSFHVLYFLARQSRRFQFQSHIHMSAFYNVLAVVIFVLCDFVMFALSDRYLDINPYLANQSSHKFVVEFLYLQIALTYFISIIPGRAHMLSAQLKQDKLNIRLNLIRYVSHEMRTPLNTAFLGLGMLITALDQVGSRMHQIKQNSASCDAAKQVLTDSQLEDMHDTTKQVQDSCHIALETLNDLLTFDKLDENKLVVEVADLDPWQLVCEAARPFEINAREKNVHFSIICVNEDSNWTLLNYVKADQFKLSQVIRNLISNALKFTPEEGSVRVIVERLIAPTNNNASIATTMASTLVNHVPQMLRITVQDTGVGISKDNQKKLFGQYVQFNAAALQQGKGSGLGLWIAKSIVEMHGGKIAGSSDGEGQGSSFTIELPLHTKDYTARSRTDYNSSGPDRMVESGNFSMRKLGVTVRAVLGLQQSPNRRQRESSEVSLLNHRVVLHDMSDNGSHSNRVSGSTSARVIVRTNSGKSMDNTWRSVGSKPAAPRSMPPSPEVQTRKQMREDPRQAESSTMPNRRGMGMAQAFKDLIKGEHSGHSGRIVETSEANSLLTGPSLPNLLPPKESGMEKTFHDLLSHESTKPTSSQMELKTDIVDDEEASNVQIVGEKVTDNHLSLPSLNTTAPDRYEESISKVSSKNNKILPVTGSFLERCEMQKQSSADSLSKQGVDRSSTYSRQEADREQSILSAQTELSLIKHEHFMTFDKTSKCDRTWETGLTVLIVDDSAPNRKMLRKLLTSKGHRVFDCYDGIDCLEKLDYLDEHSFGLKSSLPDIDVILMDEHMPRMNGPEVTKILVDRGFSGVIFAVTGTVGNADASNIFLQNGAEAVFCKPLNIDLLKQHVNRYFQKLRLQKTITEKNQKLSSKG